MDAAKRDEIAGHLTKAADKLRSAEVLAAAGQNDDAVSRAYYVLFHAASALLLIDGVRVRTHSGVANLIGLHFIARGRLDRHWSQVLAALRGERENGDYGLATFFEADHVAHLVADARAFLRACEAVVEREVGSLER